MNGAYEARDDRVVRSPRKTETGFTMGFVVCTISEYIDDPHRAAQEVAEAMNMHMAAHPERH